MEPEWSSLHHANKLISRLRAAKGGKQRAQQTTGCDSAGQVAGLLRKRLFAEFSAALESEHAFCTDSQANSAVQISRVLVHNEFGGAN